MNFTRADLALLGVFAVIALGSVAAAAWWRYMDRRDNAVKRATWRLSCWIVDKAMDPGR